MNTAISVFVMLCMILALRNFLIIHALNVISAAVGRNTMLADIENVHVVLARSTAAVAAWKSLTPGRLLFDLTRWTPRQLYAEVYAELEK